MFIECTRKWPEPLKVMIKFSEIIYIEDLQEGTLIATKFKMFEVTENYEEVKSLVTKACELKG